MTRLTRLLLVLLVVSLSAPGAGLGKGASEATTTGPGIGDGITLVGDGQPGGEMLDDLVAVGLPETAPGASPNDGGVPWIPIAGVTLVLGLGVIAALAVRSRRRAGPATA